MTLVNRDLKHIWHPCSQMKDYEKAKLLHVVSARECKIKLQDGKEIIDAISSWWCKSLGHQHPRLHQALKEQLEKFEHVIFANTTHEVIVNLAEKLSQLTKTLHKVFFASDGSSAVEIAMKMSLHARQIQGDLKRNVFIALQNGYHGETLGALSVSDLGLYRKPYEPILFKTHFLAPLPYVCNRADPLWSNCEAHFQKIIATLEKYSKVTTAIVVEPIIQAYGGMKIYSQDFLKRLREWTSAHGIHLIADEIMTGIGRTGRMLACEHADIEPDFLCLSKGLTSGYLPLSVALTNQAIYDLFYDDEYAKAFLHSHTHSGNALAASVALETLNIFAEEKICDHALQIGKIMHEYMLEIAAETKKLQHVRSLGAMVAADLIAPHHERIGFAVCQKAMEMGALLRPLGNTLYWLPPLNIQLDLLRELKNITRDAILSVSF